MRKILTVILATMLAGQAWAGWGTANTVSDTTKQSIIDSTKTETSFWKYRFTRYKGEYTYDAKGNMVLEIVYKKNPKTDLWENDSKQEYAYDANGNNTRYVNYEWNIQTKSWENYNKYEYAYDVNNKQTLDAYYYWNNETKRWVGFKKDEYVYDTNGNQTLHLYYYWNTKTNEWMNLFKYEFAHDDGGKMSIKNKYFWNAETNSLEKSNKTRNVIIDNDQKIIFTIKESLFAIIQGVNYK